MIIHLISGPRNISTALLYSFAQRPNCTPLDEPLYAYYLTKTGIEHPGKAEVLATQSSNYETIFGSIQKQATAEVFVKNMAHHLVDIPFEKYSKWPALFLIRNPAEIIHSYSKVIQQPTLADIGIQHEYELLQQFQQTSTPWAVINSNELLHNPKKVLEAACQALGIPFYSTMLNWPQGPKPYDGSWAPYWYANVHKSTEFAKRDAPKFDLSPELQKLALEAQPYFDYLNQFAIKA